MTKDRQQMDRKPRLPQGEIRDFLAASPDWSYKGEALHRLFEFDAYLDGLAFVQQVGTMAEEADHHPDLVLRWRKVEVVLTSHDVGGVSARDLALARKIDLIPRP